MNSAKTPINRHSKTITRLYIFNMTNTLLNINKESLLRKLEPIVIHDDIMKLIQSFLYMSQNYVA